MQLSDKIFDEVEDKETGNKKLVFNPDKLKFSMKVLWIYLNKEVQKC